MKHVPPGQHYERLVASSAVHTDPVHHPAHYKAGASGVECITVTRHMNFNLGNAMKYVWRCNDKHNTIEDLQKAIWYLNDEIERLKNASRKG